MREKFLQPKKARGRPATGQGTPVQVRVPDRMLDAIDGWMNENPNARSRPEAIRQLVDLGLRSAKRGSS
jgi:hypothetical protein